MDPITGAKERIGWLAVNINANDVATFGVEPAFFSSCIMLPEESDEKTLENICFQMDKAAKDLDIAIVGGHCEVTTGLTNPIVIGCAVGVTKKGNYVTAGGAKSGDKLILTKSAGIEGTAILVTEREKQLKKVLDSESLLSAKKFYSKISIVKDAITAVKTGGVNAMHDPTEGGIIGGVHEMADASNLGVRVYAEKISIQPETIKICEYFKIDPLQLISSGALLISAKPEFTEKIIERLKTKRIQALVIGEFLDDPHKRLMLTKNGQTKKLTRPVTDHLWIALMRSNI